MFYAEKCIVRKKLGTFLNRGQNYTTKGSNFRDFENWLLNRGWPLNTVPLNTGSIVIFIRFCQSKLKLKPGFVTSSTVQVKDNVEQCHRDVNLWVDSLNSAKLIVLREN